MLALLAMPGAADAGFLTSVIGPSPTQPSEIVVDNQVPQTANGDFNPAVNAVQFFFRGQHLTVSGTALSSAAAALPSLTLTGPPVLPPPPNFDPTNSFAGAAYFYGGGGPDELTISDTWNAIPVGLYRLTAAVNGFLVFPTPGTAVVNFLLTWTVGTQSLVLNWNETQNSTDVNPDLGPRAFRFGGSITGINGTGGSNLAGQLTLKVTVLDGTAAVYLPNSLEARLELVPEPGGLLLAALGGASLVLGRRGRPGRRRPG